MDSQDVTAEAKAISQRFGAAVESDAEYGPITPRIPVEVYPQAAGGLKIMTRSKVRSRVPPPTSVMRKCRVTGKFNRLPD